MHADDPSMKPLHAAYRAMLAGCPPPEAVPAIERSAVLYLEPKKAEDGVENPIPPEAFSSCRSCMMWTGEAGLSCTIHGPRETLEVRADDSCNLYVPGSSHTDVGGKETEAVAVTDSGFHRGLVQCCRCVSYDGPPDGRGQCRLLRKLTERMPEDFAMPDDVASFGCCNLWRGKPENTEKTGVAVVVAR